MGTNHSTAFRLTSTLATVAALLTPTVAAASGSDVIENCISGDGQVSETFRPQEYRDALANIPADVDMYYPECRGAIAAAMRAAGIKRLGPGGKTSDGTGTGSSWGGTPLAGVPANNPLAAATPAERADIARRATRRAAEPTIIDGRPVRPIVQSASLGDLKDLPAPLLALLASLATVIVAVLGRSALRPFSR